MKIMKVNGKTDTHSERPQLLSSLSRNTFKLSQLRENRFHSNGTISLSLFHSLLHPTQSNTTTKHKKKQQQQHKTGRQK